MCRKASDFIFVDITFPKKTVLRGKVADEKIKCQFRGKKKTLWRKSYSHEKSMMKKENQKIFTCS